MIKWEIKKDAPNSPWSPWSLKTPKGIKTGHSTFKEAWSSYDRKRRVHNANQWSMK